MQQRLRTTTTTTFGKASRQQHDEETSKNFAVKKFQSMTWKKFRVGGGWRRRRVCGFLTNQIIKVSCINFLLDFIIYSFAQRFFGFVSQPLNTQFPALLLYLLCFASPTTTCTSFVILSQTI